MTSDLVFTNRVEVRHLLLVVVGLPITRTSGGSSKNP